MFRNELTSVQQVQNFFCIIFSIEFGECSDGFHECDRPRVCMDHETHHFRCPCLYSKIMLASQTRNRIQLISDAKDFRPTGFESQLGRSARGFIIYGVHDMMLFKDIRLQVTFAMSTLNFSWPSPYIYFIQYGFNLFSFHQLSSRKKIKILSNYF